MSIACAQCSLALPLAGEQSELETVCRYCGSRNTVCVFPELLHAPAKSSPESAFEGEATCFDHPGKRAAGVCAQCGRYVCTLCQVEFGTETLCPSCVSLRRGRAGAANLETGRRLYDSMALSLSLAPLLMWPVTIVTAPAALFLSLLRWKAPLSPVRRNRWRFAAAILISLAEIGGWAWLIVLLILSARTRTS